MVLCDDEKRIQETSRRMLRIAFLCSLFSPRIYGYWEKRTVLSTTLLALNFTGRKNSREASTRFSSRLFTSLSPSLVRAFIRAFWKDLLPAVLCILSYIACNITAYAFAQKNLLRLYEHPGIITLSGLSDKSR